MKRILIIAERVYPDTGPRSHRVMSLAEGLAKSNFDVTVGAYLDINGDYSRFNSTFTNLGTSYLGIKRSDGSRFLGSVNALLSRLLFKILEYPNIEILRHSYSLLRNNSWDVVITVARPYPVHWSVLFYISRHSKEFLWLSDCGDPYPESRAAWYAKRIIRRWYENTDRILVPTLNSIDAYVNEYRNKFLVVPQAVDIEALRVNVDISVFPDVVRFGYCGTIYDDIRNPLHFMSFLDDLESPFEFHLWTKSKDYFQRTMPNSQSKVVFNPIVSREQLISQLSEMHFNLNFQNSTKVQTPSKEIDYYLAGRPILNVPTELTLDTKNEFMDLLENAGTIESVSYENELSRYDIHNVISDLCRKVF